LMYRSKPEVVVRVCLTRRRGNTPRIPENPKSIRQRYTGNWRCHILRCTEFCTNGYSVCDQSADCPGPGARRWTISTELRYWHATSHRHESDSLPIIMFSDKATYHLSGKVNQHNIRIWGSDNPGSYREMVRDSPKMNVRYRVLGPAY
jgi:hypothetical protein